MSPGWRIWSQFSHYPRDLRATDFHRTVSTLLSGSPGVSPATSCSELGPDPAAARAHAAETYARLVPLLAQQLRVRLSPDGGRNFPAGKHSRPLAPIRPQLPNRPSTISTYDADGKSQVLFLDFDVALAALPHAQALAHVDEHAAAATALLEKCGGRAISTVSPSGGRHVIVRWAVPLPFDELLRLTRALAVRFPTLDAQPMAGRQGQIRPPGALHKIHRGQLTGYMTLTMPIEQAEEILRRPCGATVWIALQQELTAELAHLDTAAPGAPATWTGSATASEAGRTCPDCQAVVDIPLDIDGHPGSHAPAAPAHSGPKPSAWPSSAIGRHSAPPPLHNPDSACSTAWPPPDTGSASSTSACRKAPGPALPGY